MLSLMANIAFTKELPALFEVKIPEDQYTNTNDGLNKAFNRLIQKLSGSRSKKFLWRIGDVQLNKIEFVSSYSTELIGEQEFLSVRFNGESLIPELRKIGTPLIGFNRPVILILFKIDTGESAPVYLSSSSSSDQLAAEIKQTLKNIALERGVYLELPEFDLEDQNLLNQANILFSPSNYIEEKFYNDAFLAIELVRIGINQWSVNGDLKADVCIIPPNSFALARTVEYFRIPRNVLTICLGKSTYARCGIIVNVTPLEPEWEGHVTLEFSNTTNLPAKIYAGEGVAQMIFFESDEDCEVSYKDRGGKYQGQTGVTLPKT